MSIPLVDVRINKTSELVDLMLAEHVPKVVAVVFHSISLSTGVSTEELMIKILTDWADSKVKFAVDLAKEVESRTHRANGKMTLKQIPKRRKKIFDLAGGKCHYCGCEIELTGKWHIDHKIPKALMGTDEDNNLVASCVPCNLKKRDRTDTEFNELTEA